MTQCITHVDTVVPARRSLAVSDNLHRYPPDLQPWGAHASGLAVRGDGTVFVNWYGGTCRGVNEQTGAIIGDPLGPSRVYIARLDPDSNAFSEPAMIAGDGKVRYMDANLFLDGGRLYAYYVRDGAANDTVVCRPAKDDDGTRFGDPQVVSPGGEARLMNPPIRVGSRVLASLSAFDKKNTGHWRDVVITVRDDGSDQWRYLARVEHADGLVCLREPCLIEFGGELQMYCRVRVCANYWAVADDSDPHWRVQRFISTNGGRTWSEPMAVDVPNYDSKVSVIALNDRQLLMAYNAERGRFPLRLAVSGDSGVSWRSVGIVNSEAGEMSYPTLFRDEHGGIHLSYTWKRREIHYVAYDPAAFP